MESGWLKWVYAYLVAGISDIADLVLIVIFGTPVIGDVFDFITIILLAPVIGKYALLDILEFIPAEDPVPTYIISVVLAQMKVLGEPFSLSMERK